MISQEGDGSTKTWRCSLPGCPREQRRDSNRGDECRLPPAATRSDHLGNGAQRPVMQISAHSSVSFRGCPRQGPRGRRQAGGKGKKGRSQAGAPPTFWQSTPKGRRSSPSLRFEFTPAALVAPFATLSASSPVTCAAERPQLLDVPLSPNSGHPCRMGLQRWW